VTINTTVKRGFDVHRVIFLDRPDTRTAVLSDLIDVGSLHQPHADGRYKNVSNA